MKKTVRKAIIPAAGLGTRMLPISHAVCKEMLPIVDMPAVSYLVEEAVRSGITEILIITNREKDDLLIVGKIARIYGFHNLIDRRLALEPK